MQVAGSEVGVGGPSMSFTEASDVLSYVIDVAASIGSVLQASNEVRVTAGDSGGDNGGVGMLALRSQGMEGEVSPEGLAAALALAFEATLPAVEEALTSEAAASSSSAQVWQPYAVLDVYEEDDRTSASFSITLY